MKYATYEEYQAAKAEIISGQDYTENTEFPNQSGMMSKQYSTATDNFFEVTDPKTYITEFWSTKQSKSRYYDGSTKDGLIAYYEKRLELQAAEAQKEKNAAIKKAVQDFAWCIPATEYKGRVFAIQNESPDPYPNSEPKNPYRYNGKDKIDTIELAEATYMGGDLYIVPLQVYWTDNPAMLKVVFLVECGGCGMWYSDAIGGSFAKITQNNIRTAYMTHDRKLQYWSGAGDDGSGIWDLAPVEWRYKQQQEENE